MKYLKYVQKGNVTYFSKNKVAMDHHYKTK